MGLILVHNSKTKNQISLTKQSIVLRNLMNINSCIKQFLIEDLREEIHKRLKNIIFNRDQIQIGMQELSSDYNLIHQLVTKYLIKISMEKKPWESQIEFPFYVQFVNLCQQRHQQRKQAFIEVRENTGEIFDQTYSKSSGDKNQVRSIENRGVLTTASNLSPPIFSTSGHS